MQIWNLIGECFGAVRNYVEPFFGSGAVLLGRPTPFDGPETINDLDGYVANFWRAIKLSPEATAEHADWPVSENDLHARHIWLVGQRADLRARLEGDPDYHDPKIAGWWAWGICSWIGSGWCSGNGPWSVKDGKLVHLGDAGRGVNRKLVHLGDAGRGVNRQLVHLGNAGQGVNRKRALIFDWFQILSDRLRNVRIASGDWSRVTGDSVTTKHGQAGVFLDPPYGSDRTDDLYATESNVTEEVQKWCATNGSNPLLRVAVCGYKGEYELPGWTQYAWKAPGGFGSQGEGRGRENAKQETIWFSPHCLNDTPVQMGIFDGVTK